MKKRIVSFLLLVAMVVTALPLVAFPVVAASEAPEFTADDYNDLYVTEGLDYAADFFVMNEYWNTEGKTFTIPTGPSEMTAYEYKGYTYNFTIEGERYEYVLDKTVGGTTTEGTTVYQSLSQAMAAAEGMAEEGVTYTPRAVDINDAIDAAIDEWFKVEEDFFRQFLWAGSSTATLHSYKYGVASTTAAATRMANSATVFSPVVLNDGYLTLRPDYNTNGGFYPSGFTSAPSVSAQFVVTFPADYSTNSATLPFLHVNARPRMKRDGEFVVFTSYPNNSAFAKNEAIVSDAKIAVNVPTTFTSSFVLSSTASDKHIVHLNDVKAFEVEGTYGATDDAAISGSTIIAWGSVQRLNIYAVRNYTKELTAAEIRQNHFADIVKWFKLDITPLALLDETDMQSLYTSFAAFTFDSDRAAVAEALLTAATALTQAKYSSVNDAWVALAVQYGLDISPLLTMPKGMLVNTIAFLNDGYKTSANVKADYEAAFVADIAALTSDMTPAEYNALYAAQDYLVIAIDYLSASEHWGTEALAPNSDQYAWKWVHPKGTAHKITAATGTVGNGFLSLHADFILGETFSCNDGSLNGSTTEMTFHDASAGAGTYLDIDDVRISASLSGDTVAITRLAMRNDDGTFRYPAGEGEWAKAFLREGFYTFKHSDAATTAVLSMVRPAYTETYYGFAAYVSSDTIVLPTAAQLGKTETGDAATDLKTVQNALSMLNSNGTLKTASQYGSSYFYVTHDLVDGELVARNNVTAESGANKSKYLFAFYKPVYHVADDGRIYIVGATYRPDNNGMGHGLGNDFLDGSAESDFYTSTPGSLSLTLNGTTVFDRDDVYFLSNNLTGGSYFRYGYKANSVGVDRDMYAYRSYKCVLTADELARNHFVDIAKFFRLNLTGLDTLIAANNTEALNAVYASVAHLDVATATRTEAQLAVTSALNVYVDEVYEELAAEHPELATFIAVACDYRLDLDAVLSSARDMSSVYAVSFDGLSCAAAQALLDEAYLDAYYYLSYQEEGADEWNALLAGLAASPEMTGANRLDLEALMALPLAERVGILDYKAELEAAATLADAQLVVDAYVAVAMEKYASADADYNAIYVKDGLRFAFDMMNASSAWGGTMPTLPQQPSTLTDYWYDADGDGERDEGEIYDFTKEENRNGGFNYSAKKGDKTYYPNADQSYTSEEEARAAAAKTLAGSYYKDYAFGEIVECINIAYRTAVNEFYAAEREFLAAYTWYTTQTDTRGNKIYIASYNPYNSSNLVKQMNDYVGLDVLTYTLGDGCLVMRGDYSTDGGLQMFSAGADAAIATETSLQFVAKIGTTPIKKYEGVLFHNARPLFAYNATKTEAWFSGFGNTSGFKGTLEATEHFSTTKVQDLTFTLSGLLTANDTADCDTLTIATQDKVLGVGTGNYLNGTNALTVNATNYIGYSCSAVGNEIYAIRYYAKALSLAEIRQNHFADLAKYYKLDLTGYLGLSDSLRAEAHDLLSVYTVGDTSRDELAAALSTVVEKQYEGMLIAPANPELNAAFLAVAAFAALDLSPIENLDAADRTAIAELVVANFNPAYAINAAVVQSYYAELTEELSFLTFAGYQVRLTSGTVLADYAGVRAVFDIDAEAIFDYLEEAAEAGYTYAVILEAHVVVDGEIADTLQFSCLIEDGEYYVISETDSIAYVRTNAAGEEVLSFNYTVTYKGEEHRKDYLEADFGYAYSIHVVDTEDNAVSRNFSVNTKTFGDTVSAAELYTYFAGAGYAEDNVVKSVMDTLAE